MLNNLAEVRRLEYFSNMFAKLGAESFEQQDYKRAFIRWQEALQYIQELNSEILKKPEGYTNIQQKFCLIQSDIYKNIVHILKSFGYERWENKDYITALVYFEEALKLCPDDANLYNTIAFMYKNVGHKHQNLAKQIEFLEQAVKLDPNHLQAVRSLAVTYPLAQRYEDSLNYFHKLFKLGPIEDDYLAYAEIQIRLGNFKEGWKYYEHRFFIDHSPHDYPVIDKPKWEGQAIPDKTLLVCYEFGFGDSIQFSRYIEQLKPLAKKIIFWTQDCLVDLFRSNLSGIEVVGISTPLDELAFDYHISLLSLPHLLDATVENIPPAVPYFKAAEQKVKAYKDQFFDNDCLKIGIAYSGSPLGNVFRDVALEVFYPLTKLKNVKVYSFQKGFGSEQLEELPCDVEIVDLGKTFEDFSDTAAAMANVDLFVSSDNGVLHLAAAMGKKTFLLLNKHSEWRWFFDEESTPWYECVRILKKQDEDEDWSLAMQKVIGVLKEATE